MIHQLPTYQSNIIICQSATSQAFLAGLLLNPPTATVPTDPPAVVEDYDPADFAAMNVAARTDARGEHQTMALQAEAKRAQILRENQATTSLKLNLYNGITAAEQDAIKGADATFMAVALHTMIIRWSAYHSNYSIADYATLQQMTRAPFDTSDFDAQASHLRRLIANIAVIDNVAMSQANQASILMDKITAGPLSSIMEKVASDYDRDHPSVGHAVAGARTFDGLIQLIRTRFYAFTAEQLQDIAQTHANLATISVTGTNADIASIAKILPSHHPQQLLPPQQSHLPQATIPVWPQGDNAAGDCEGSEAGGIPDG
jgi:hypothetical protein